MDEFKPELLQNLYIPVKDSHKGQNGKVMVIAGSKLFHAAALWALEAASHLADMVYFSSTDENNDIVQQAKQEFRNGIVIPRDKLEMYIQETDSILIGPGLPREEGYEDGENTRELTEQLLKKYPDKRWVIDGGSLQVMDPEWIPEHAILTPHQGEYDKLFSPEKSISDQSHEEKAKDVYKNAQKYHCVIVLKGQSDIICSPDGCVAVSGGNAGMTKGGTGDVLAGTAVGLYAKNKAFLSACAASYLNKRASEKLYEQKGYWYNSSDLLAMLPRIMKETVLQ